MQFELPGSFLKDEFRTQIGATRFISPEIVENDVRGDIQRQEDNFRNMAGELLKILDARKEELPLDLAVLLEDKREAANEVAGALKELANYADGFIIREGLFQEYHAFALDALTMRSFEELTNYGDSLLNALIKLP